MDKAEAAEIVGNAMIQRIRKESGAAISDTLDPLVRCPACDVLGWIDSLPGGKSTCRVCRYTWTPN